MRRFMKSVLGGVLMLAALQSPMPMAQDIAPMVMVPDHPTGVPVNGCFRANQNLFGPYRLTFCLDRRGTYQIRGGGVRCDGRLDWRTSGRNIHIDLHRTSCGRGQAWERASIECRNYGSLLGAIIGRVIVGQTPRIRTLRCTYFPTVRGERPVTFTATRQ
jgi:hypothetical protein